MVMETQPVSLMKKKLQITAIIVLTLFLGALIIQNRDPVETHLLFVSIRMPQILLLMLTSGLGFILGLLMVMFGKVKPPE
jgi:uncharacterized integral membrane protein